MQHQTASRSSGPKATLLCSLQKKRPEALSLPFDAKPEDVIQQVCPCCQAFIDRSTFHSHVVGCFNPTDVADMSQAKSIVESIRSQVSRVGLGSRINMIESLHRLGLATRPRKSDFASQLEVNITHFDNQILTMLFSESSSSPFTKTSSPVLSPDDADSFSDAESSSPSSSPLPESMSFEDNFLLEAVDKDMSFDKEVLMRETNTPTITGKRKDSSDFDEVFNVEPLRNKVQKRVLF